MSKDQTSKYIEGTQIVRETGLTVDYKNVFFGIRVVLNKFIIRNQALDEESKRQIINKCAKIKTYSEEYGTDFVNDDNRAMVLRLDSIAEEIRSNFGSMSADALSDDKLRELSDLLNQIDQIISPGQS